MEIIAAIASGFGTVIWWACAAVVALFVSFIAAVTAVTIFRPAALQNPQGAPDVTAAMRDAIRSGALDGEIERANLRNQRRREA